MQPLTQLRTAVLSQSRRPWLDSASTATGLLSAKGHASLGAALSDAAAARESASTVTGSLSAKGYASLVAALIDSVSVGGAVKFRTALIKSCVGTGLRAAGT